MGITGKFNTDTDALSKRIQAHDKYGSNDLNQWIFDNLNIINGNSILDLGCGTGKQTIPIAKAVGKTGNILSIDLSQEALEILLQEAIESGLEKRINALCCRHDDVHKHLQENTYDRVVSSYSLYYSENPEKVIKTIWGSLKPEGVLFFCGPSKGNNRELKTLHYGLMGIPIPPETGGAAFMEDIGQRVARQFFREVEIVLFENPLRFDSAASLYTYWSSYNLYDEKLDDSFKAASIEHFTNNSVFETMKRVIGVKAIK